MTEKKLARIILTLIEAHGKCWISDQILADVFDLRTDRSDGLKPLFEPGQEALASFCRRYWLKMEPGHIPGRTIFVKQKTAVK
jgi:hypothetical protein